MEKSAEKKINRWWFITGSAAYTFVNMPAIVVREVKNEIKEKKKAKKKAAAYKGLVLMKKYCDELVEEGRMDEEKRFNLIATTFSEIVKEYGI